MMKTWRPFKIGVITSLFIVFAFCAFLLLGEKNVTTELSFRFTKEDHHQLSLFFKNIFVFEDLGYTLFGEKPMSFCFPLTCKPQFSKTGLFKLYRDGDVPYFKALKVWKNIQTYLNKDKYSLIIYEDAGYPTFVILINKKAFLETVNKNICAFRKVYGNSINAEWVLKKIEEKAIDQDQLFNQHLLLGIMLGYGRHSSELFQRRCQLDEGVFNPPFLQKPQVPNKEFASLEEELECIIQRFQNKPKTFEWYTNTFPLLLRVTTVVFSSDPNDPEAQMLKKKYQNLHSELTAIFDREDWLDVVLSKLTAQ